MDERGRSGASLLLDADAMHFASMRQLLRLQPLALETWIRAVGVALSVVLAIELHELLRHPHR